MKLLVYLLDLKALSMQPENRAIHTRVAQRAQVA
jgi:hypothetical protein